MLGSPHSAFDQIVDAIGILSRLAVASLQEDDFGRVSKDVPTLIRTFAATISMLETFVAGMSVHWTDVTFKDRRVEEVDILVAALREGLKAMLVAFEEFSAELEIGEREMREAKRLAEMEA